MAKITVSMVEQILQLVGGAENIILCGNCMTRLRLTLKDRQLIQLEALKKIPGVLGVVNGDDQLQVILGPGKAQTASELMNTLLATPSQSASTSEESTDLRLLASQNKQQMKAKQKSAVHNFLTKFATIFTPLIPGFIAAGLLLGIATLLQQTLLVEGATQAVWLKSLIAYMKVFSIGLFTFLSILIGFNTQRLLAEPASMAQSSRHCLSCAMCQKGLSAITLV